MGKNLSEADRKIMDIINKNKGIRMAAEILVDLSQNEVKYARLSNLIKSELDWQSREAEARHEGIKQEKFLIAKNLLAEGSTFEFVQKITGLSIDKIKNLQ